MVVVGLVAVHASTMDAGQDQSQNAKKSKEIMGGVKLHVSVVHY